MALVRVRCHANARASRSSHLIGRATDAAADRLPQPAANLNIRHNRTSARFLTPLNRCSALYSPNTLTRRTNSCKSPRSSSTRPAAASTPPGRRRLAPARRARAPWRRPCSLAGGSRRTSSRWVDRRAGGRAGRGRRRWRESLYACARRPRAEWKLRRGCGCEGRAGRARRRAEVKCE